MKNKTRRELNKKRREVLLSPSLGDAFSSRGSACDFSLILFASFSPKKSLLQLQVKRGAKMRANRSGL